MTSGKTIPPAVTFTLELILLIPGQRVIALTPECCMLSWDVATTILFGLTRPGLQTTIYCTRVSDTQTISPTIHCFFKYHCAILVLVGFMVFNALFNNITVILWWSVLFVEDTGGPGENHRPVASYWQTLSHNVASSTPRHERGSNSYKHYIKFHIFLRHH